MTHFKNKALLDFYNHTPKHDTNKNFKIKDVQDYVPKPTPINLPEPPPIAKNIVLPKPTPIIIPDAHQKPIGKDGYMYNGNPFIKALSEPDISDAEGLKRAYESDSNTYKDITVN